VYIHGVGTSTILAASAGHVTEGISNRTDDFHAELPKKLGQGYGTMSYHIITTQVHTATSAARHVNICVCSATSSCCGGDSRSPTGRGITQRMRQGAGRVQTYAKYVSGISAVSTIHSTRMLARWHQGTRQSGLACYRRTSPQAVLLFLSPTLRLQKVAKAQHQTSITEGHVSSRLVSSTHYTKVRPYRN
jgi:hypothetical protein